MAVYLVVDVVIRIMYFLGFVPCKEDEKKLAKLNDAGKCHEVGIYCSKKVSLGFTKICVEKRKVFVASILN
ncbi:conjugal transfer protein TraN [Campylobacter jejuni]|nr:conjugal transfer protein TraN [Campylobacter jejuni]